MKRTALLVLLALGCSARTPVYPAPAHHLMARVVGQADVINFNPQGTGTTATPGALTVQNIAGALKQVDDQGNVTTLGGAVSSTWAQQRLTAITAIDPTLTEIYPLGTANTSEDFEVAAATSTGLFIPNPANFNGAGFVVRSGTTAGGLQIGRTRDAIATNPARFTVNQKTQSWATAMRIQVRTTPDAQARLVIMDVNDNSAGVSLEIVGSVSTVNFALRVVGGGTTNVDTLQPFPASGTWCNVALVFDRVTVWLVFNDVKVATGLTNLANFGTGSVYLRSFATNGSTAANQEFWIQKAAIYTVPAG